MKILVLGATGYLGTHICEFLKSKEFEVEAYIRNPKKAQFLDNLGVHYEVGDILDQPKLENTLKRGFDVVINSVGYVNDRGSWSTFRKLNAESCTIIANAMQKTSIKRLIHISSAAAYGESGFNATEDIKPVKHKWNKYGVTKLEGEENLQKFKDLDITILRPCHVLGRGDRTGIVPVLYHTTRKFSRWIEEGNVIIPVVYVDDVCKAIELCIRNPESTAGEIYNVANEDEITVKQVLEQMTNGLLTELPKKSMSYRRAYYTGWINEGLVRFLPIKLVMTRAAAVMAGKDASLSNAKISKLGWKSSKTPSEMVKEWVDWRKEYEKNKK